MNNEEDVQTKLFDRSSYSTRTLSVYQLVGAYLVDVYYNHLYAEATKLKNQGKVPSITEGYKHATFAFVSALDNKFKGSYRAEHYNNLLREINKYFIHWTSYNSLTLSECIDKIVREFIPEDYYKSLDKDQKRNILRLILINTIKEFTKIIVVEHLGAIIDNHEEQANADILKERIIDLFILEREKMFHKFLENNSGEENEKVDKKFAEKMRTEITKLHEERNNMSRLLQEQNKELDMRKEQLSKVLAKYRKLEMAYRTLQAENKADKEKISDLEEQINMNNRGGSTERFMFDSSAQNKNITSSAQNKNITSSAQNKNITSSAQNKNITSSAQNKNINHITSSFMNAESDDAEADNTDDSDQESVQTTKDQMDAVLNQHTIKSESKIGSRSSTLPINLQSDSITPVKQNNIQLSADQQTIHQNILHTEKHDVQNKALPKAQQRPPIRKTTLVKKNDESKVNETKTKQPFKQHTKSQETKNDTYKSEIKPTDEKTDMRQQIVDKSNTVQNDLDKGDMDDSDDDLDIQQKITTQDHSQQNAINNIQQKPNIKTNLGIASKLSDIY